MANPSIKVPYRQGKDALERLLAKVRRSGDFFVHGARELPMPKVEVDGVGVLSFPVPPPQVRELIAHAERAPYGRGEATILDTSVRKVWQLPPETVRLGGKSWAASLQAIVAEAAAGLGCAADRVSAEFYKMLVYDQGAFFAPHRDTEKTDGMFATLVVVLPSVHRGGELVIRHAGREVTVDVGAAEMSELAFVAFYADCQHEVRPVVEGNRVCLIYNLLRVRGAKSDRSPIGPPLYDAEAAEAGDLIAAAMAGQDAPSKLVWLLEHQYSPSGLGFSALKNADAARAKVLARAAELAQCALHLGIVHIEESGPAELTGFDGYGYGKYAERWDEDDEDDDDAMEDADDDDYEVVEVSDASCHADHWVDAQDRHVDFGPIPLEEGELLPQGALDGEPPDEQRLTEATGNEGASFERSYHRAAVVLWPLKRFASVLLQAGVAAAMPYLNDRIDACRAPSAQPAERAQAIALAARIIAAWEKPSEPWQPFPTRQPDRAAMLDALGRLGDPESLKRFVGGIVRQHYDGTENAALAAQARLLGRGRAGDLFPALVSAHMHRRPGACMDLLARLLHDHGDAPVESWTAVLRRMATAMVAGLASIGSAGEAESGDEAECDDGSESEHEPGFLGATRRRSAQQQVTAAFVADLLDALRVLAAPEPRATAAAKIAAAPAIFVPGATVVPALALLHHRPGNDLAHDDALLGLWIHASAFLLDRSKHPPEDPADWRQEVTITCACEDCRALTAFARDAKAQVGRFRLREGRRQHLHRTIDRHRLDMTHVTERKGSPHTLVCTKTRGAYLRRCAQYRDDIRCFGELTSMLPIRPEICATLASRMIAARKRAETWTASAT
jgi:predicted 2-oxoglutarate/Fe(II)-dependent dioxygenase YbiX